MDGLSPAGLGATPLLLALQGGGSHGALAWGALDTLLARGARIDAVSGSSAGALNASVLASGLANGGPDTARAALDALWHAVGRAGRLSPYARSPMARVTGRWDLDDSPLYLWLDAMSRVLSPYQTTPPQCDARVETPAWFLGCRCFAGVGGNALRRERAWV